MAWISSTKTRLWWTWFTWLDDGNLMKLAGNAITSWSSSFDQFSASLCSIILSKLKDFFNSTLIDFQYGIREVFWNARKSMWKMIYSCDSFCPFFSKCPKIEEFHFRFLFCFKIDHVHFFRNARFSYHITSIFGHFEKNGQKLSYE